MYLTSLYDSKTLSQMTEDLVLRSADNNETVNVGEPLWQKIVWGCLCFLLILLIWIFSPLGEIFIIGIILQFLSKSKAFRIAAWILQSIVLLCSIIITLWLSLRGIITNKEPDWKSLNIPMPIVIALFAACILVILFMILIMVLQKRHQKKNEALEPKA